MDKGTKKKRKKNRIDDLFWRNSKILGIELLQIFQLAVSPWKVEYAWNGWLIFDLEKKTT